MRLLSQIIVTCIVAVGIGSFAQNSASGALITSISGSPLANNAAGQTLTVSIRSDAGAITDVESFNIFATIGTGLAGQAGVPVFTGFAWDPAIQAQLGFAFPTVSTPEANDFRGSASLTDFEVPVADNSATIGTTPTAIGTFTIDTTGITDDTFDFRILTSGGATSDITTVASTTTPFTFTGSFDVGAGATAVPEPGSFAVIGLVACGLVARRKRRAAIRSAANVV